MANTDPFEVSKALRPFARTIKVTEAAVARGRTGAIQHGYRPKTWAMNGKRTSITTDGAKENTRYVVGGGPTKAGGAVAAGAAATGTIAAKKKLKKNMSDPFEINKVEKGPFRRPSFQNTRRENTKVGATVGAGMYGSAGAGIGAGIGVHEAKRGIRALDSVGAHPGKLRAAKLVAGHAGKGGAALGVLGAASGAALGSVIGATAGSKGGKLGEFQRKQAIAGSKNRAARLDRKAAKARSRAQEFSKSAFGVEHDINKADRRMGGQATWSGHLPKHTSGAVAASKSAFRAGVEMPGHLRPVKPGLRTARALKTAVKVIR